MMLSNLIVYLKKMTTSKAHTQNNKSTCIMQLMQYKDIGIKQQEQALNLICKTQKSSGKCDYIEKVLYYVYFSTQ